MGSPQVLEGLLEFVRTDPRLAWDIDADGHDTLRQPEAGENAPGTHERLMAFAKSRHESGDVRWPDGMARGDADQIVKETALDPGSIRAELRYTLAALAPGEWGEAEGLTQLGAGPLSRLSLRDAPAALPVYRPGGAADRRRFGCIGRTVRGSRGVAVSHPFRATPSRSEDPRALALRSDRSGQQSC